jgi:hypothetical protein
LAKLESLTIQKVPIFYCFSTNIIFLDLGNKIDLEKERHVSAEAAEE